VYLPVGSQAPPIFSGTCAARLSAECFGRISGTVPTTFTTGAEVQSSVPALESTRKVTRSAAAAAVGYASVTLERLRFSRAALAENHSRRTKLSARDRTAGEAGASAVTSKR
jgi:hypothetical protein